MVQQKPRLVRVFVHNFILPPMTAVLGSVTSILKENFTADHVEVHGDMTPDPSQEMDMVQFYDQTMQRTQDMFEDADPNLDFTACVAPISVAGYNIVAVAARNAGGREWLLSQFIGAKKVPRQLVGAIAQSLMTVLEKRGALTIDPEEDSEVAETLATLLATSVDFAVESMLSQHTRRFDA